jgi:septal ring factor EnvC (AmiA/AmiB activator)
MARRRVSSATPLNQKQQELARREEELRRKMEDLQRMIEEAPRVAEERSRREREELLRRAHEGGERLDVSIALNDKRFSEIGRPTRSRPRSLRKQRSEGRLVFLVLLVALTMAIVWIATHLPF